MSNSRHRPMCRNSAPAEVRSYSITHPPGQVLLPTQPGWDYLVYAHTGLVTAITADQAWTIPAHRALCVPDGTRVRIESARRAAIRCLYLHEGLDLLSDEIRVVNMTSLTRELLAHAVAIAPMNLDDVPANRALITLLAAQLADEPKAPLQLALPVDPVARQVAVSIMSDPAGDLEHWLRAASASRRTVERRFRTETLMSLGQWRRRARILAAVSMLAQGRSVTDTAIAVGYASPSAFVSAFKSELGSPPRVFMQS